MIYKIVDRSGVDSNSDDNFEDVVVTQLPSTSASNQENREGEIRDRSRVRGAIFIITVLVLINVVLFGCLGSLVYIGGYTSLLSPSLLAFSFGIRHAVDADHIAAIDNVTRKLIRDGRRPLTVGLWFSLGHSTIVVILCILIAVGSTYARDHLDSASSVGSIVGTIVSATVLLLIGSLNLYVVFLCNHNYFKNPLFYKFLFCTMTDTQHINSGVNGDAYETEPMREREHNKKEEQCTRMTVV